MGKTWWTRATLVVGLLAVAGLAAIPRLARAAPVYVKTTLFSPSEPRAAGVPIYVDYRIPAVVRAQNGDMLAVAEGRMGDGPDDSGNIDVVSRRSTDNGVWWSPIARIWSKDLPAPASSVDYSPSGNTVGNPTLLVQKQGTHAGRIWLMMNWNSGIKEQKKPSGISKEDWLQDPRGIGPFIPGGDYNHRRFYLTWSDDHGVSWAAPVNITGYVYRYDRPCGPGVTGPCNSDYRWDSYHDGVGPGLGIQLESGPMAGALVFPAYGRNIYCPAGADCTVPSNWANDYVPGGSGSVPWTSESAVVERDGGSLLRVDRPVKLSMKCIMRNALTTGELGGPWSSYDQDNELLAPAWAYDGNSSYADTGCNDTPQTAHGIRRVHSSLLRYTLSYPKRIFHTNLASTVKRRYPTIRVSYDEGATWPIARRLESVDAAYTAMAKTANFQTLVLVENGYTASNREIWLYRVNLEWILNGQVEPVGCADAGAGNACGAGNPMTGCWCDALCETGPYYDCCPDKAPVCGGSTGSCMGACGGAAAEGCWCDSACYDYGDCCPDRTTVCE